LDFVTYLDKIDVPSGKHTNIAIENGHRNSGFSLKKW
jgi:hypothetical protein